jgi:Mn-dependent DtxR family transcriptional regulator
VNRKRGEKEAQEDLLRVLLEHVQRGETPREEALRGELASSEEEFATSVSALETKGWLRRVDLGLFLTPAGLELARKVLDRHETAERFFAEVIGEPASGAHEASSEARSPVGSS